MDLALLRGQGGHVFGNFPKYTDFHGAEERVKLVQNSSQLHAALQLSRETPRRLVDVGANSGELTLGLVIALKESGHEDFRGLGVEIDPELVEAAKQRVLASHRPEDCDFLASDALDYLRTAEPLGTHVTTLWSTSMWIHLVHGDEGLEECLRLMAKTTRVAVIIEPQLWRCYKNAASRLRKRGMKTEPWAKRKDLLHNSDEKIAGLMDRVMWEEGFGKRIQLGTAEWDRSTVLYLRRDGAEEPTKVAVPGKLDE